MIFLFSNFAEATLSSRLEAGDTTLRVAVEDAGRFPQPDAGARFSAIIYDGDQAPEVVWGVSNPLTGDIVVERGKESSVAKRWLPGSAFIHTLTTASIEYFTASGQQDWIDALVAEDIAIRATLAEEVAAREALAAQVDSNFGTLNSGILANSAAVQLVGTAVADQQAANAAYQVTLSGRVGDAEGLIEDNYLLFTTFESVQTAFNVSLSARVDDADAAILSVGNAQADFESATTTTLDALTADLGDTSAALAVEQGARVTQYDALAGAQTTLSSTIAGVSGSLVASQLVLADIEGNIETRYGINLTAGGVFAGFSVMAGTGPAGGTVSQARFAVDDFILSDASGLYTPFVFDVADGIAYLENIAVHGASIENASIGTAQIANAAIGTAQIANAAITNALIGTAAIQTANIGDLQVETIKIKNYAVSETLIAQDATSVSIQGSGEHSLISLVVTVLAGERVDIVGAFSSYVRGKNGTIGQSKSILKIKIKRGSTILIESGCATAVVDVATTNLNTRLWSEIPGAGTYTYYVVCEHSAPTDVSSSTADGHYIAVTRTKK